MKRRLGPLERLYPMPCVLVVGGTMAQADTLAVAWINIMSSTPPTVAMGLRATRRTLELIRENATFTVNVPTTAMAAQVDFCGTVSGRSTDKIAVAGLTLSPSAVVDAPLIEECPFNLECRVVEEVNAGNYVVVIGEVVETHAEEALLVADDSNIVDVAALDPLVYIAGAREYRAVGRKIGDAYSMGRAITGQDE